MIATGRPKDKCTDTLLISLHTELILHVRRSFFVCYLPVVNMFDLPLHRLCCPLQGRISPHGLTGALQCPSVVDYY